MALTYRQTQPCWTVWWTPEGGRCSRTCCHSCRCWPRTGWRHRRPGGVWPNKMPRRERTSSSWETSVRWKKEWMDGYLSFCVAAYFITFLPPSLSPQPPANHLLVCLQFLALVFPPVLWLVQVKLDLGTPRLPPERQKEEEKRRVCDIIIFFKGATWIIKTSLWCTQCTVEHYSNAQTFI